MLITFRSSKVVAFPVGKSGKIGWRQGFADPVFAHCVCVCVCVCVLVPQSCLTLCNPMDCSLPESSVHGILQARILESRLPFPLQGIFPIQGSNPGLPHCRQILYHLSGQGSLFAHFSSLQSSLQAFTVRSAEIPPPFISQKAFSSRLELGAGSEHLNAPLKSVLLKL